MVIGHLVAHANTSSSCSEFLVCLDDVAVHPVGHSLAPADSNIFSVVTAVGVPFSSVRNRCCALEKKTFRWRVYPDECILPTDLLLCRE
jgi:hypothetical protein